VRRRLASARRPQIAKGRPGAPMAVHSGRGGAASGRTGEGKERTTGIDETSGGGTTRTGDYIARGRPRQGNLETTPATAM
jgi:hypothetical protein